MTPEQRVRAAEWAIRTTNVLGSPGDSMVLGVADLLGAVAQDMETNPTVPGYAWLEALALAKLIGTH
jgi:hypothetical protein